ncbi:NAD(P)-binding protein [Exidia glandulosa HHB12029]|uniref:NAD(P)-binding protein n=1 Tax=Exidia glandulosa HHB12029 TaxID=1314781 RepID=A0A165CEH8_EXIGL|nr:NAD(P)-binding protein [Exidia glandulosa HHB12029]
MSTKPVFVVAGVGNGQGTGAASAHEFSKAGYRVALIARNGDTLQKLADELKQAGGEAKAFPVTSYEQSTLHATFAQIRAEWPGAPIRVAVWNAGDAVWKPFLDVTEEELRKTTDTNIIGSFAFAREAILSFKDLELDEVGKRGALIFTSATAALRGNKTTSVFAAGKFALRSLSQSLAKEFGPQNIHVSTAIIDGPILTDRSKARQGDKYDEWSKNENVRIRPESIAKSYLYLANQDRSAWTWELDLRAAHEPW